MIISLSNRKASRCSEQTILEAYSFWRTNILFTSGSSNAQIAKIGTVNINAHHVVGMDVGTTPSNPGGIAVRSPNNYEQIFIEGGATRYGGGTNPQIAMGLHYTTSDALIMKYDFNSASDEAGAQIFTYHGDEDSSDVHDIDNSQEYVRIQANLSGSVTICEDGLLAGTGGTNAGGVANGGVVSIGAGFDATKQETLGYGFYVNSDSMINGDLWLFSGNGNGSLGVGGIGPSGTTGEIKASADIVAFATSDIRLKENINPIQDALFKVRQLQGIEFDWKESNLPSKMKTFKPKGTSSALKGTVTDFKDCKSLTVKYANPKYFKYLNPVMQEIVKPSIMSEIDALSKEEMMDRNITMDDIHFAITNSYYGKELNCVYSDLNSKDLIFRIRLNSSVLSKTKKDKNMPESLDQSDHIYLLRNFQESILNNIVLRGISDITNVLPVKVQNNVVKEEGRFKQQDIWTLQTTGSNLLDILAEDFIDSARTISNDIKEVYDVLGIEAARQIIYNEIIDVMKASGVSINYHHLSLLCDRMTSKEGMVSIFRSGILNDNIGPISKSTFEVHTEVLLTASRHADFDHMRGVSANIMTGQLGNFGTGGCGVVLDLEKMKTLEAENYEKLDDEKEIERAFNEENETSNMYSKSNIEIKNNISTMRNNNVTDCVDDDYDMGF